jgi:hypothetical protein
MKYSIFVHIVKKIDFLFLIIIIILKMNFIKFHIPISKFDIIQTFVDKFRHYMYTNNDNYYYITLYNSADQDNNLNLITELHDLTFGHFNSGEINIQQYYNNKIYEFDILYKENKYCENRNFISYERIDEDFEG